MEESQKSFRHNISSLARDYNKKLKPNTEKYSIILFLFIIIFSIGIYIISNFFTTYNDTFLYISGYTIIVGGTIILFMYINLCINFVNKQQINY